MTGLTNLRFVGRQNFGPKINSREWTDNNILFLGQKRKTFFCRKKKNVNRRDLIGFCKLMLLVKSWCCNKLQKEDQRGVGKDFLGTSGNQINGSASKREKKMCVCVQESADVKETFCLCVIE